MSPSSSPIYRFHEDPHPEFTGSPQEALRLAESAATRGLEEDHKAAVERRLARVQAKLEAIVQAAEANGGDRTALSKWKHDYFGLIKSTSLSKKVLEWVSETMEGMLKSAHEGEKMTERTSYADSTSSIKPSFLPHVKVVRAILKTEGEIWYQELSIFLKDLQEYIHTRIVDGRPPYLGSREDYVYFDQCFTDLKTGLLPLKHRKEEVSKTEWFKRFHAMKVLLELVKLNQPVIGDIGLTKLFSPNDVLARMHSWTPSPDLVARVNIQGSLRKFRPIGRNEISSRF